MANHTVYVETKGYGSVFYVLDVEANDVLDAFTKADAQMAEMQFPPGSYRRGLADPITSFNDEPNPFLNNNAA